MPIHRQVSHSQGELASQAEVSVTGSVRLVFVGRVKIRRDVSLKLDFDS